MRGILMLTLALLGISGCGEPAPVRPVPVERGAATGKTGAPAPATSPVSIPMH